MLAAPVAAQQATQVALIEGDAPGEYRAAGAVIAEVQSASNTLPKQKLDEQLRAEASKLGADAVIQVAYQMTPAGSAVNYKASGVAIRYARQAEAVAPQAPSVTPPADVAVAHVAPAVAAVAPTAPELAAAPAPTVAAPAVAVGPPVTRPVSAAQVELSESSMQGRRYVRLAPVSAIAHQKSMFPRISPKQQVDDALRAEAFRAGADAVIEVKYEMVNPAFSRKGNRASGIAIRFE
jgi:uncharacterized protein YbjQ (UPF0145 family)